MLPFYRGICACAERVRVRAVPAMRAACLDKSVLASPRASLCASAFLQVLVMFFQRPGRDDNGNVETKPVCSGLLHYPNTVIFSMFLLETTPIQVQANEDSNTSLSSLLTKCTQNLNYC